MELTKKEIISLIEIAAGYEYNNITELISELERNIEWYKEGIESYQIGLKSREKELNLLKRIMEATE